VPGTGRLLAVDPLLQLLSPPAQHSLLLWTRRDASHPHMPTSVAVPLTLDPDTYTYALSSPLALADPSGLQGGPFWIIAACVAVAAYFLPDLIELLDQLRRAYEELMDDYRRWVYGGEYTWPPTIRAQHPTMQARGYVAPTPVSRMTPVYPGEQPSQHPHQGATTPYPGGSRISPDQREVGGYAEPPSPEAP